MIKFSALIGSPTKNESLLWPQAEAHYSNYSLSIGLKCQQYMGMGVWHHR